MAHIISGKLNIKGLWCERKRLLTDFLDLGVDREEAGRLDLFLRNSLNVAESKFSTAKHLHDVWRCRGNAHILGDMKGWTQ